MNASLQRIKKSSSKFSFFGHRFPRAFFFWASSRILFVLILTLQKVQEVQVEVAE